MPYQQSWTRDRPGCVIFLVDQSGSMADTCTEGSVAPGQRLDHMVATILNKCISELGSQCMKDVKVSPRVEIAMIGYGDDGVGSVLGGALAGKDLVSITELMENPLRLDERTSETMDDAGNVISKSVMFPVFLDPKAAGGTPMNAAVEYAGQIASEWVEGHRDSHPPVVINITDGIATDGDPRPMADYLKQLTTDDGNLLMFNFHISPEPGHPEDPEDPDDGLSYPVPGAPIPQTDYDGAQVLHDMSSEIPNNYRNIAAHLGLSIRPGAKGLLLNADPSSVIHLIRIVSTTNIQAARAAWII